MNSSLIGRSALLLGITLAAIPSALRGQDPVPATAPAPAAQSADLPVPAIAIASVVEDNQKLLRATVTLKGAALEGAQVSFGVVRTFGVLDLGSDTSLDDGTAGVLFPEGLPGGSTGTIEVVVNVRATKDHAAASSSKSISGAGIVLQEELPFPHALWSSKPLWPLVAIIVLLLTGVWSTYVFVVRQLVKIRREGLS